LAFKYAESHLADYPGADGKVVGQVVPADPVALTIVQNAADYLVNSVRAVANKLKFTTSKEPVTVSVVETTRSDSSDGNSSSAIVPGISFPLLCCLFFFLFAVCALVACCTIRCCCPW
jgi:hypothetical protein